MKQPGALSKGPLVKRIILTRPKVWGWGPSLLFQLEAFQKIAPQRMIDDSFQRTTLHARLPREPNQKKAFSRAGSRKWGMFPNLESFPCSNKKTVQKPEICTKKRSFSVKSSCFSRENTSNSENYPCDSDLEGASSPFGGRPGSPENVSCFRGTPHFHRRNLGLL